MECRIGMKVVVHGVEEKIAALRCIELLSRVMR